MSLRDPLWLWALLIPTLSFVLVLFRFRGLEGGLNAFTSGGSSSDKSQARKTVKRRFLAAEAARWAASAAIIAALAEPFGFERVSREYRVGLDIVFALDISRSMTVDDLEPSRLDRALDLMLETAMAAKGLRSAVVLGKGEAVLALPLSDDSVSLRALTAAIRPEALSAAGSNLERLIERGAAAFPESSGAKRLLIILSDGESLSGSPEKAASALKGSGIISYFVGVGTNAGGPIALADGSVHISRLREDALRHWAELSDGRFLRLDSINTATILIDSVKAAVSPSSVYELKKQSVALYPYFVILAALLLAVSAIFSSVSSAPRVRLSWLGAAFLCVLFAQGCDFISPRWAIARGNWHYGRGSYQNAISAYAQAERDKTTAPYAAYGIALSYEALNESEAALSRYTMAIEAGDSVLSTAAAGNAGLIHLSKGAYTEASTLFRQALENAVPSGDKEKIAAARRNLELALRYTAVKNLPETVASLTHNRVETDDADEEAGGDWIVQYVTREEEKRWRSLKWEGEQSVYTEDY